VRPVWGALIGCACGAAPPPAVPPDGDWALVEATLQDGVLRERWAHPTGPEVGVTVGPRGVRIDDRPGAPLLRRWDRLGAVLNRCVGDPFAQPLAGDPAARRTLSREQGAWRWRLAFAHSGPCELAGDLRLDAAADRVDAGRLYAAGAPWAQGGREAALARLDGPPPSGGDEGP